MKRTFDPGLLVRLGNRANARRSWDSRPAKAGAGDRQRSLRRQRSEKFA